MSKQTGISLDRISGMIFEGSLAAKIKRHRSDKSSMTLGIACCAVGEIKSARSRKQILKLFIDMKPLVSRHSLILVLTKLTFFTPEPSHSASKGWRLNKIKRPAALSNKRAADVFPVPIFP